MKKYPWKLDAYWALKARTACKYEGSIECKGEFADKAPYEVGEQVLFETEDTFQPFVGIVTKVQRVTHSPDYSTWETDFKIDATKVMTIQALNRILKAAGFGISKYYASGRIKGAGTMSRGYELRMRKDDFDYHWTLGYNIGSTTWMKPDKIHSEIQEGINGVLKALKNAGVVVEARKVRAMFGSGTVMQYCIPVEQEIRLLAKKGTKK